MEKSLAGAAVITQTREVSLADSATASEIQTNFYPKYAQDRAISDDSLRFARREIRLKDASKGREISIWKVDGADIVQMEDENRAVYERLRITKYNYISWLGYRLQLPWLTVKWYGHLIYFRDSAEMADFLLFRWQIWTPEVCPVCGEPLKRQLRYCLPSERGLPREVYYCSLECLQYAWRRPNIFKHKKSG